MRRAVVILVLFLGLAGALGGQTQQGSWSNLNRLKAGQGVEVIEFSLKRHAGKFVTVTDELVTIKENGSNVSVKREDVVRVSPQARRACPDRPCSRRSHRGRHWRRLRLEDRFLGGLLARNFRACWHRDWCPKRSHCRRRPPRPYNRLPCHPSCPFALNPKRELSGLWSPWPACACRRSERT